jgi:hypothetical protein
VKLQMDYEYSQPAAAPPDDAVDPSL